MTDAVRPINLNFDMSKMFFSGWLLAVTALVIIIMFRQADASAPFKAASIDSSRLVSDVRSYVSSNADYPDLVQVEVIEFLKYVQVEMDNLVSDEDVALVVTAETVLAGNFVDYTDFVYLHAKDAYEKDLPNRKSYSMKSSSVDTNFGVNP